MRYILIILALFLASCNTAKNLVKDLEEKRSELSDSVRLLTIENQILKADIRELQYAQLIFDTITVTNHDTVTVHNTITITPDGGITATNLHSVIFSKEKYLHIISEKNRIIDSLSNKKQVEITKTITVTKTVRRSFIPLWIWIIVAGLVAFNFRNKIKSIWTTFH